MIIDKDDQIIGYLQSISKERKNLPLCKKNKIKKGFDQLIPVLGLKQGSCYTKHHIRASM